MPPMRALVRKRRTTFTRSAFAVVLTLSASGCTSELTMAEVHNPSQPDATIRYSAVRRETRLFADYSVVDARILAADAAAAAPAEGGPKR